MALSPTSKSSEQPFEEPKATAVPTQQLSNPFDDDMDADQDMLHTESSLDGYEHDNTIQLQLQNQLVLNLNVDDEERELEDKDEDGLGRTRDYPVVIWKHFCVR